MFGSEILLHKTRPELMSEKAQCYQAKNISLFIILLQKIAKQRNLKQIPKKKNENIVNKIQEREFYNLMPL